MGEVLAAAAAFVGSHFLLSHPLRAPLVGRIGERAFLILYSLVAVATMAWLALAYRVAPAGAPLWDVGDGLWAIATIVMLVASMLLMGSLVRNPALPDPTGRPGPVPVPHGVLAITRHPMMWAFALWGAVHILIFPDPANIVLSTAIVVLALVGAHMQDRKKAALQPDFWPEWERRTSYLPFAAVAQGRARIGRLGMHTIAGGVLVWLLATWAHRPLSGWDAGIWRWIG